MVVDEVDRVGGRVRTQHPGGERPLQRQRVGSVGQSRQPGPQGAQLGCHRQADRRAGLSPTQVLGALDRAGAQREADGGGGQHRQVAVAARRATASASTHAEALGVDPASAVRALVKDVAIRLNSADGEQLVQSAAGGMQLSAWLVTRTFELTVHTLDIAAATGILATSTPKALADAASLAAHIAATVGTGETVLRALTGRGTLPNGFFVL